MRLILIRHTTPSIASGMCYGRTDLALAETFPEEAEAVRLSLADIVPDIAMQQYQVFSSPLTRCKQLAYELFESADVELTDYLTEINFGDWEMRPWDAIDRREIDAWRDDVMGYIPSGGESVKQMQQRTDAWLQPFLGGKNRPEVVIVVAHSGVIRTLLATIYGWSAQEILNFSLGYGELHCLELKS